MYGYAIFLKTEINFIDHTGTLHSPWLGSKNCINNRILICYAEGRRARCMCRCFASCSSGLRVQRSTKVSLLFCEAELELPCYPHEKVHRSVNSHNSLSIIFFWYPTLLFLFPDTPVQSLNPEELEALLKVTRTSEMVAPQVCKDNCPLLIHLLIQPRPLTIFMIQFFIGRSARKKKKKKPAIYSLCWLITPGLATSYSRGLWTGMELCATLLLYVYYSLK